MESHLETAATLPPAGVFPSRSLRGLGGTGEVEIAGRVYATGRRIAEMLGVTERTLARWNAARIGPPKIKIGKVVLYELSRLSDWLASREIAPVRSHRH
jgi:hypothetical protein